MERITDGQDGVYPRELINFCNFAKKLEFESLKEDIIMEDDYLLISGRSIITAFPDVSKTKVTSYLSEFDWLAAHFQRFEGKTQAEYSKEQLFTIMKGLEPSDDDMLRQLYETGILKPNTNVVTASTKFIIPRLFRIGLGIVIPGRS